MQERDERGDEERRRDERRRQRVREQDPADKGTVKEEGHHYQVPDPGMDPQQASRQMDPEPRVPVEPDEDTPTT